VVSADDREYHLFEVYSGKCFDEEKMLALQLFPVCPLAVAPKRGATAQHLSAWSAT